MLYPSAEQVQLGALMFPFSAVLRGNPFSRRMKRICQSFFLWCPPAILDVRILGAQHLILAAIIRYQDQSRLNLGIDRGGMVDSRGDVSAQNQQQFRLFDRVILNQKLRDPNQDGTPKRKEKKTYQKLISIAKRPFVLTLPKTPMQELKA